ncbi:MAG TPA: penicillin-binding protein 1C [Pseudomonadota bacterium]|nr:penicillin-binding protein 1C [Pseudomonadota bacterium]
MSSPRPTLRRWRWPLRLGFLGCLLVLVQGAWLYFRADARLVTPRPSRLLLDRHGRYLGEVPGEGGELGYWPLAPVLPERIAAVTLETEDRHFYEHSGVYVRSLGRAAWQNLSHLRVVSGGSTLPMQVARMQHPAARSLLAKLREAAEALGLLRRHGHDLLLRQYLTLAPYGNRAHGVVRAARLYFDKPVEDLSWLQAAFLAALPQQPGRMNPFSVDGKERALQRAHRILRLLHQRRLLSDDELAQALTSALGLVPPPHRDAEAMHAVLAWSRRLAARPPGELIIRATLDLDIQHLTTAALRHNLGRLRWAHARDTAAVVTEAATGELLAYVGSQDYFDSAVNGAIDYLQVKRSPGSALKPFIYGLALQRQGHTAASELADVPTEFSRFDGAVFVPENMTHNFLGPMLLREALGNSRNIPALQLLGQLGVEPVLTLMEQGGVSGISHVPGRYGLGLAIGAAPVTPLELAVLYSALSNRGETRPLRYFIGDAAERPARLLSPDAAQMIAQILADDEARRPGFARGNPLEFDYAVAAKTGTSQGYRDAWAAGFSDRLLVVVWVGNDDASRMNHIAGAGGAAPAFHRIMDAAMNLREPWRPRTATFEPPATWNQREVCPLSGKLAGPLCPHHRTEWFAPGTEPSASCPYHAQVALDLRNGLRAGPGCPARFTATRPMLALGDEYADWALRQRLELAPTQASPLCAGARPAEPKIVIREPKTRARYLYDPDTPREYSAIRLSAAVTPPSEEIVWLVDGTPIARVGWPHEARAALAPGRHLIRAAFVRRAETSSPVAVMVDD